MVRPAGPSGVAINPETYTAGKPTCSKRWERRWNPTASARDSATIKIKMARLLGDWPQMAAAMALEPYADFHASR